MSAETRPITPRNFARALEDLPIQSLHLKVLELRNSIAHLEYSNEQLRPFADGTGDGAEGGPDADCAEAIAENEQVVARMDARIGLIRAEVERRGASWTEFLSKEEAEELARRGRDVGRGLATGELDVVDDDDAAEEDRPVVNGVNGTATESEGTRSHPAWSDGTFQTGTIRNGQVSMDAVAGSAGATATGTSGGRGGRLTDEELRRVMEERMRELEMDGEDEGDGSGLHL